jgi:hypothetical protein
MKHLLVTLNGLTDDARIFFSSVGTCLTWTEGPLWLGMAWAISWPSPKPHAFIKKMQQASPALATTNASPPARCPPRSPDPAASLPPRPVACLPARSALTQPGRRFASSAPWLPARWVHLNQSPMRPGRCAASSPPQPPLARLFN